MSQIATQINNYLHYLSLFHSTAETTLKQKKAILFYFARITRVCSIEELDNMQFNRWIQFLLNKHISASSLNIYNSIIIAMIKYYREIGASIPLNMTLIQKRKTSNSQRVFYSKLDIDYVISLSSPEVKLMIKIMFDTGMRITELAKLQIENINNRQIKFIGKGSKPREVYITKETSDLLQKYIEKYNLTKYLWGISFDGTITKNGEPPTVNTIRNHLKKAFKKAGFDNFYPHAIRHSFATDLQLSGASVTEIKEMMGHESVATTERYLHGFDGRLKDLFDKYH